MPEPTVILIIGGTAIARDERGELLEAELWITPSADWKNATICDHRGGGGEEGYALLDLAVRAAEANASSVGFDIHRVPAE